MQYEKYVKEKMDGRKKLDMTDPTVKFEKHNNVTPLEKQKNKNKREKKIIMWYWL